MPELNPRRLQSGYNLNGNIHHHQNPSSFQTLVDSPFGQVYVLIFSFLRLSSLQRSFSSPVVNEVDLSLQSCRHVSSCLNPRHCWVTIIHSFIHSTNILEHPFTRDSMKC